MKNPYLPTTSTVLGPEHTRRHREEFGPHFHQACLEYAQSLWLRGKPAQAILQLNKAGMIISQPFAFEALAWFLLNQKPQHFIGNPVRHFQHLATRISGPDSESRSWRAWACFHLAEQILSPDEFPRDHEQIEKEALVVPEPSIVTKNLTSEDSSFLSAAQALVKKSPVKRP